MRGVGIAVIAAVGGTLLSPSSPLAGEPPVPPQAVLTTPAKTIEVGKPIQLDSSASVPGSAAIVGHSWDLDGDGTLETDTGAEPAATLTPKKDGPLAVQVRVLDDQGQTSDAKLDLIVGRPAPSGSISDVVTGTSTGQGQGIATGGGGATTAPALVPARQLGHSRTTRATPAAPRKAHKAANVTAAASTGVTIKNFKYAPSTSSVHVGDTITWTNQDVAPHTATAKNGSWDTGTINKGKTGSHTFTQAGTFPYICSIHPSMRGTVTVLASSGSGGSGSGSSGSSGSGGTSPSSGSSSSSSSSSGSSSGSSLPHTGLDIAVLVFIAMCLSGSGASLRRALR
jgi:plastocyanin